MLDDWCRDGAAVTSEGINNKKFESLGLSLKQSFASLEWLTFKKARKSIIWIDNRVRNRLRQNKTAVKNQQ